MRYVGLITFRDYALALREDGRLYRIRFDFYAESAQSHETADPIKEEVQEVLRLPLL